MYPFPYDRDQAHRESERHGMERDRQERRDLYEAPPPLVEPLPDKDDSPSADAQNKKTES